MKQSSLFCTTTTLSVLLLISCYTVHIHARNVALIANDNQLVGQNVEKIKTNSGLEYIIEKPGTGASPVRGQQVKVHYTGWLNKNGAEGTKFDSSRDRGVPFVFVLGVGHVIRGWDEGVLSMKVGEKRRLFIPAKLGYGSTGAPNVIPPNADLIFDVELLDIAK
jgi:FKBP-type peptidyl-prolyl cis-trans isomerase